MARLTLARKIATYCADPIEKRECASTPNIRRWPRGSGSSLVTGSPGCFSLRGERQAASPVEHPSAEGASGVGQDRPSQSAASMRSVCTSKDVLAGRPSRFAQSLAPQLDTFEPAKTDGASAGHRQQPQPENVTSLPRGKNTVAAR